jgi:hypothetical protein
MKDQTKTRILRAYQVHKSIRKVSRIFGLSFGTIHQVLKEKKALLPWDGFKRVVRSRSGRRGPVTKWIEKHPGIVMPSNVRDVVKLTGCASKDAHSWKVARWNKLKRAAKKVVPSKIIKTRRYQKLEIELLDGTVLGVEELLSLEKKLEEKKEKKT